MSQLVYGGKEFPKFNFHVNPDGRTEVHLTNKNQLSYDPRKDITWLDAVPDEPSRLVAPGECKPTGKKIKHTNDIRKMWFDQVIGTFSDLTETKSERKFFHDYVDFCQGAATTSLQPWSFPALIPQVWVNYLHYDHKDRERAERAKQEPFRVDFVMKYGDLGDGLVVFEIDGDSHFKDMQTYTEHLQKDRWLRNKGYQVFRISDLEVDEYDTFCTLFSDVTNAYLPNHLHFLL